MADADDGVLEMRALQVAVGRALWKLDLSSEMTGEDRRAHWAEHRRDYIARARKLIGNMRREGVTLNPPADAVTGE